MQTVNIAVTGIFLVIISTLPSISESLSEMEDARQEFYSCWRLSVDLIALE